MIIKILNRLSVKIVDKGNFSLSVTKENSNDFKYNEPPEFMKCEINITNKEIGYSKKNFLLKQ